ncbi:RuvB-like protein 2 [Nematocida homosporus]|uniref:RuvB-like protein 2 n=1 Tax=Nematocida homosporus TaxID=1912981 RepID=UPI00221EC733|nr:RuvB-like protein 2 [Nematocida homosporus]KAI5185622.1 RuvB-like protein 2 [Nematocida homosporus]
MLERVNALPLVDRIGAYSHILGLGEVKLGLGDSKVMGDQMSAGKELSDDSCGLVGQVQARQGLKLLQKLAASNQGRLAILAGPAGSGKGALLAGLKAELKREEVPCTVLSGSEIHSSALSKTEILMQGIRQSLGMRVKEISRIIEGEVVEISVDRERGSSGKIVLKTTDIEGIFTLGEKMLLALYQERVEIGDVVRINKTTGTVQRLGRALSKAKDHELIGPNNQFIPTPEGELLTTREERHTVTFHEIDLINCEHLGPSSVHRSALEIPAEVRESVDASMKEWVEEGKGELVTGMLFIPESHLLDLECYAFLNTVSELRQSPVVILATDRELGIPRGGCESWPFGVPSDFFSRALLIQTTVYSLDEVQAIVRLRLNLETVNADEETVRALAELGQSQGLRYCFSLISILDVLTQRQNRPTTRESLDLAKSLFPPNAN